MFSLNLSFRVSFVSFTSKVVKLLWGSLFPFGMTHETCNFSDGCLSVPSSLWVWLNLTFNNHYFILQYKERTGHAHFPQNCFDCKKASSKIDRHHIPVQRSTTISGLSVIISLYWNTSDDFYCVKNGQIRSFSGPYFTPFGLIAEIQSISPHSVWIFECGKIWTRKTPNMDTYAVFLLVVNQWIYEYLCETSIQSPGPLLPLQYSGPLCQSFSLLL